MATSVKGYSLDFSYFFRASFISVRMASLLVEMMVLSIGLSLMNKPDVGKPLSLDCGRGFFVALFPSMSYKVL